MPAFRVGASIWAMQLQDGEVATGQLANLVDYNSGFRNASPEFYYRPTRFLGSGPHTFYLGEPWPDVFFSNDERFGALGAPQINAPDDWRAFQQFGPFDTTPPAPAPDSSWFVPFTDPVRVKPGLRTAAQQAAAYVGAAPFPETVSFDRWNQPLSQPYPYKRRLRTGAEPYQAFQPTPIIDISWWQPLAEPRRYKASLRIGAHPFFSFQPTPIIDVSWYLALSEPKRFKPSLRTAAQLAMAMPVQPATEAMVPWFSWLSEPKRFRPALRTAQIPAFFFQPWPVIDISWWVPLTEPKRYRAKLIEGSQMTFAMNIDPVVTFSWIYGLSEPVRKKPTLIEAAKEKASHMIFVNPGPPGTGPLYIRRKYGRQATFWVGRSDGR